MDRMAIRLPISLQLAFRSLSRLMQISDQSTGAVPMSGAPNEQALAINLCHFLVVLTSGKALA